MDITYDSAIVAMIMAKINELNVGKVSFLGPNNA